MSVAIIDRLAYAPRRPGPAAADLFPKKLKIGCFSAQPASARYGGQSGMRCTSREPHAEQTKRRDLAKWIKGISATFRSASNGTTPQRWQIG